MATMAQKLVETLNSDIQELIDNSEDMDSKKRKKEIQLLHKRILDLEKLMVFDKATIDQLKENIQELEM